MEIRTRITGESIAPPNPQKVETVSIKQWPEKIAASEAFKEETADRGEKKQPSHINVLEIPTKGTLARPLIGKKQREMGRRMARSIE